MLFMPCVPWNADGYGYSGGNYDGGYSGGRGGARGKGTHYSVLSLPYISYLFLTHDILNSMYSIVHIRIFPYMLITFIYVYFFFSSFKIKNLTYPSLLPFLLSLFLTWISSFNFLYLLSLFICFFYNFYVLICAYMWNIWRWI